MCQHIISKEQHDTAHHHALGTAAPYFQCPPLYIITVVCRNAADDKCKCVWLDKCKRNIVGNKIHKQATVEHIGGTSSENKSREILIDKTMPNYYLADSKIAGTKKALILHIIRTFSYGIESLNIKQPKKHRTDSFAIFKGSLKFLLKRPFKPL